MTPPASPQSMNDAARGIGFILLGMLAISVNDMLIKLLSGGYPLHQMVFVRSAIGICFTLVFVKLEGGFAVLRVDRPALHVLRGFLVVVANMTFFAALAVLPLAEATALFFAAPLFITLLSIPILGERVGPWRIGAVLAGFAGVLVMLRPWQGELDVPRIVLVLPVLAALTYSLMQLLTRKLGVTARASAMALFIQGTFLVVSSGFFLVAGDGRFAEGLDNESLVFLFRAWILPEGRDILLFLALGAASGVIGYSLSAAYRAADVATIAPFEYAALPLALVWGWLVFGEWPSGPVWVGITLIAGAGLFVFLRERTKNRPLASRTRVRRRY